jgi:hypothetical protein
MAALHQEAVIQIASNTELLRAAAGQFRSLRQLVASLFCYPAI